MLEKIVAFNWVKLPAHNTVYASCYRGFNLLPFLDQSLHWFQAKTERQFLVEIIKLNKLQV